MVGGDFIFVVWKNQILTDIDTARTLAQQPDLYHHGLSRIQFAGAYACALPMHAYVCLFVCMQSAHRINLLVGVATEEKK